MLFRIAVNVANDHGRAAVARHRKRHAQIEDVELTSELPSAEREVLASQTLDLLLETIDQLPPKCKQVFLLSRASDMTYPEIAAHCGISVKMVEKHISRAIAACLEKVGSSV
jgi:RNA polymerase sigma-70 factor (ECF subfamily)